MSLTELGRKLDAVARNFPAPPNLNTRTITSEADLDELKSVGLAPDYRTYAFPDICADTFIGLEFNPELVSTQSFIVHQNDEVLAVMTVVVEAPVWINRQRYFVRSGDSIAVADINDIVGQTPSFCLVPGFSQVNPTKKLVHARYRVRLLQELLKITAPSAPPSTWYMVGAQGLFPFDRREELEPLWNQPVGTHFDVADLPEQFATMGTPRPESAASAKFGRMMGWPQLSDVGDQATLGPIYARRIS